MRSKSYEEFYRASEILNGVSKGINIVILIAGIIFTGIMWSSAGAAAILIALGIGAYVTFNHFLTAILCSILNGVAYRCLERYEYEHPEKEVTSNDK